MFIIGMGSGVKVGTRVSRNIVNDYESTPLYKNVRAMYVCMHVWKRKTQKLPSRFRWTEYQKNLCFNGTAIGYGIDFKIKKILN